VERRDLDVERRRDPDRVLERDLERDFDLLRRLADDRGISFYPSKINFFYDLGNS